MILILGLGSPNATSTHESSHHTLVWVIPDGAQQKTNFFFLQMQQREFTVPRTEWVRRVPLPPMKAYLESVLLPDVIRIIDGYLKQTIIYNAFMYPGIIGLYQDGQCVCLDHGDAYCIPLPFQIRSLFTDSNFYVYMDSNSGLWGVKLESTEKGLCAIRFIKDKYYIHADQNNGDAKHICSHAFVRDQHLYHREFLSGSLVIPLSAEYEIRRNGTHFIQDQNWLLFPGQPTVVYVSTTHLPKDFVIESAAIQYDSKYPLVQILITLPESTETILYQTDKTQKLIRTETNEPLDSLCSLGYQYIFHRTVSGDILFQGKCLLKQCGTLGCIGYTMFVHCADYLFTLSCPPHSQLIYDRFVEINAHINAEAEKAK